MKVTLVDYTDCPERQIAEYAAICYDSDTSDEACTRRIKKLMNVGHLATLRFAYATFKIEGISRVCSHQFVRSKHLDFLQESQRYVNQNGCDFVYPYCATQEIEDLVLRSYLDSKDTYDLLISRGMRKEDARMVLPNATTTSLYVTGNFQAWKDFLALRKDPSAQWEIQNVAYEIEEWLNNIAPHCFPIGCNNES